MMRVKVGDGAVRAINFDMTSDGSAAAAVVGEKAQIKNHDEYALKVEGAKGDFIAVTSVILKTGFYQHPH